MRCRPLGAICSKGLRPTFACDDEGEVESAGVGPAAEDEVRIYFRSRGDAWLLATVIIIQSGVSLRREAVRCRACNREFGLFCRGRSGCITAQPLLCPDRGWRLLASAVGQPATPFWPSAGLPALRFSALFSASSGLPSLRRYQVAPAFFRRRLARDIHQQGPTLFFHWKHFLFLRRDCKIHQTHPFAFCPFVHSYRFN